MCLTCSIGRPARRVGATGAFRYFAGPIRCPRMHGGVMQLGFDTIGNATLIAYDGRPVLACDPWIAGPAYFGSWALSHEIPPQQMEAIRSCDYVWFSHGHPDHLNGDSLPLLRDRQILLPAHVGQRIFDDLKGQGYKVRELPTAQWIGLSSRIRVMCL